MMRATPSMPAGMPTAIQGRELATATTLVVVDAMIAARTEAQALASRDLRPSANTSSTSPSHHGTDHQPTSQNALGKRTLDYDSRIIGLLAKLVERIMWQNHRLVFHQTLSAPKASYNGRYPSGTPQGRTRKIHIFSKDPIMRTSYNIGPFHTSEFLKNYIITLPNVKVRNDKQRNLK